MFKIGDVTRQMTPNHLSVHCGWWIGMTGGRDKWGWLFLAVGWFLFVSRAGSVAALFIIVGVVSEKWRDRNGVWNHKIWKALGSMTEWGWNGGWGGPHQVSSKLDQNCQSKFLGLILGGWGGLNIPLDMLHVDYHCVIHNCSLASSYY